jgi:hypothetical protein
MEVRVMTLEEDWVVRTTVGYTARTSFLIQIYDHDCDYHLPYVDSQH